MARPVRKPVNLARLELTTMSFACIRGATTVHIGQVCWAELKMSEINNNKLNLAISPYIINMLYRFCENIADVYAGDTLTGNLKISE